MINFLRNSLLIVFLSFGVGLLPAGAEEPEQSKQVLDTLVAVVDGEPLTWSELKRYAALQGGGQGEELEVATATDSLKMRTLLRELILERVLDKEAEAIGISVGNDEIDAYIDEIKRQNGVDDAGFDELLAGRGISRAEYVKQIRNDILKNRVVSARVRAKVNIVDEDVQRFIEEHPDTVPAVGSVRLQEFKLAFENNISKEDVLKKLSEAKDSIEESDRATAELFRASAGTNFRDLGYLRLADLKKEIREQVESLKVGAVSEPVELDNAAALFFLAEEVTEKEQLDSQLRAYIEEQIFKEKFNESLKNFLDKELPKRYHVEVML